MIEQIQQQQAFPETSASAWSKGTDMPTPRTEITATNIGNDIYVMDSKVKKSSGFGSKGKKEKVRDGFEENVVQVWIH